MTDLVSRKEVNIEYCLTDEMIADYMTKPLVGSKFKLFRDLIMNLSGKHHCIKQQECVEKNVIEEQKERNQVSRISKTASSDKFMSQ